MMKKTATPLQNENAIHFGGRGMRGRGNRTLEVIRSIDVPSGVGEIIFVAFALHYL